MRLALAICAFLLPAAALAQEEEELELFFATEMKVTSVSKGSSVTDVRDAPAQVTVITAEEIRAFGYRTLAEIVRSVPECFEGGDRMYSLLGLRGFARAGDFNTRVLVLLDGHPLNEHWNSTSPVSTDFPLDLAQLERVEVITGPVSAIYGSNAFFGVVNVVTRKPTKAEAGVSYRAGSAGDNRVAAFAGAGSAPGADGEPWHLIVQGVGSSTEGDDLTHPGLGTERGTDWQRNGGAYLRAERGRLTFFATSFTRRRGSIAGAYGANFGDEKSFVQDTYAIGEIRAEIVRGAAFNLRVRGYGDFYEFRDEYRYDPDPVFHDFGRAAWTGGEIVGEWRAGPSELVISVEDSYNVVRQDSFEKAGEGTIDPDPDVAPNNVPEDKRTFNLARVTAQETVRLLEGKLTLFGGVYVEHNELYGTGVAPRAGVVAWLLPWPGVAPRLGVVAKPWTGSTVKALYGRGFRSPSVFEAFFDDDDAQTANDELRAETADGFEGVVRQKVGRYVEVTANAFHAQYRDLIVLGEVDVDPGIPEDLRLQYQNGDEISSSGGTLAFQVRRNRTTLRFDGTGFTYSEKIPGSPEWVAHAVLVAPLVVSSGNAHLAARVTGVGARVGNETGTRLSPYAVADVAVRINRVYRSLGISAGVTNLADSRYDEPAGDEYPVTRLRQPGRRLFLEARWEW